MPGSRWAPDTHRLPFHRPFHRPPHRGVASRMNRRRFLTAATASAAAVCATGPSAFAAPSTRAATASGSAPLRTWFEATYRSITAMTTDFGLTADKIDVSGAGAPVVSAQTSPTNIGGGLWSTVAAAGLGVISASRMHERLARTVAAVE